MPKKILLADDSITIQKVVELTFSDGDYEVIATSNGAKAIQKLADVRPDIILSDIIMPEKNGYELCEFVKSHPDYRTIPVILLTGTFEPFDPDRAEKAGCDAVVTKPFESQGLIHKVEELIAQAAASRATTAPPPPPQPQDEPRVWPAPAPAEPPPPMPAASVAAEELPFSNSQYAPEESSPFADEPAMPPPVPEPPAMPQYEAHSESIFGGAEPPPPPPPLPLEEPPMTGGETRAFPPMNFSDLQGMEPEPAPAAPAWPAKEEPVPRAGETLAFPQLSPEDLERMSAESATRPIAPLLEPEAPAASSPQWSPETPAFEAPGGGASAFEEESPFASDRPSELPPTIEQSFGTAAAWSPPADTIREPEAEPEIQPPPPLPWESETAAPQESVWSDEKPAVEAAPAWEPPAETPAWQAPAAETPAQQPAESAAPSWDEAAAADTSAWEEAPDVAPAPPWSPPAEEVPPLNPPAEELAAPEWQQAAESPAETSFGDSEPSPGPWDEAPETAPAPAPFMGGEAEPEPAPSLFMQEAPEPASPEPWEEPAPAPAPSWETPATLPSWTAPAGAPAASAITDTAAPAGASFGELSDEQVDRIARRVVEMISADIVKNIAWEVIPDLAESIVRERIRQLEAEA